MEVAVQTVYSAVDELIADLKGPDFERLARILDHRLHRIAWTSAYELLEELQNVLKRAMSSRDPELPDAIRSRISKIVSMIESLL